MSVVTCAPEAEAAPRSSDRADLSHCSPPGAGAPVGWAPEARKLDSRDVKT